MILSQETLSILKNYQSINTNLIMYPGNILYTQSNTNRIFAMTKIEEEIPKLVHIYDLPSLLGVISLSDSAEIEFSDNSLFITNQNGAEFEFFYSDPSVVYGPPNKTPKLETVYSFDLSKDDITTIVKATGILKANVLSAFTKKDKVYLSLNDPKTPGSNTYRKMVGPANGLDFDIRIDVSDMKMIPDDYQVNLTTKKFTMFKSHSRDSMYVVAGLTQSRI